ncbi:MAG TPA: LON peptidase substrate-binding domain-containing protein [Steroidobacteraceae bacterium]|jgi:Lon protease-like protein|nr:LON peptidase substrate-binding domain-containing protein [Steroidobacteraceae bacterium]
MPERVPAADEIALFPLHAVLFPGGPLPLRIFEPRYIDMVRRSLRTQSAFGVVLLDGGAETGGVTSTAAVGTTARIADFYSLPDGLLGITCLGVRKFQLRDRRVQSDGLHLGAVDWLAAEREIALPAEYQHLGQLLRKVLPELGAFYEGVSKRFEDSAWVGYRLAEILPLSLSDKQYCLELDDPLARLARLSPLIQHAE